MMKRLIAAFLGLTITGVIAGETSPVDDRDWIELRAGTAFSFRAPPGTISVPVQGIASLVGQFVNPPANGSQSTANFVIGFDYGAYSSDLSGFLGDARYTVEDVLIDRRPATLVTGPAGDGAWECRDGYIIAMHVVVTRGWWTGTPLTRLEIHGCTRERNQIPTLQHIFRSIQFH